MPRSNAPGGGLPHETAMLATCGIAGGSATATARAAIAMTTVRTPPRTIPGVVGDSWRDSSRSRHNHNAAMPTKTGTLGFAPEAAVGKTYSATNTAPAMTGLRKPKMIASSRIAITPKEAARTKTTGLAAATGGSSSYMIAVASPHSPARAPKLDGVGNTM